MPNNYALVLFWGYTASRNASIGVVHGFKTEGTALATGNDLEAQYENLKTRVIEVDKV